MYVDNFWERERLANSTRRKPLETLDYIAVPLNSLPLDVLADLPEVQEFHEKLLELSKQKIVNFAGYSNTDLKLAYGAPNIHELTEFDRHFEELITLLQEWAFFLLQNWGEPAQACPEEERKQAAKTILSYAVSVGSDISATYERLIKLYLEAGETDKLPDLQKQAEKIHTLSKRKIIGMIESAETSETL